jgi:uncharacterized membrane protein required for colicin V production
VDAITEFITGFEPVDLVLILYFAGFFVLGFAQGTIRRLIGIGCMLFSFLFAANVAGFLGEFLGANWTQFPEEYAYMIGFGTVFVAATIAFAIVVQGFYKPQPLFENARFIDELLGGLLGLVQAALLLGFVIVILDSFFLIPGIPEDPQEIGILRDLWTVLNESQIVEGFRQTLIPFFFGLIGFLVPDNLESLYTDPAT